MEGYQFTMEKPDKNYLSQAIKLSIVISHVDST